MRSFPATLFFLAGASLASGQTLKQPGIILEARAWNDIRVQDDSGATLLTLTGLRVKPQPALATEAGTVKQITSEDGLPALEIGYQLAGKEGPSPVALTAVLVPRPGRIDARYTLSGLPADAKVNMSMLGRRIAEGASDLPVAKLGLWKRHADGGQPQEHPDGKLVSHLLGDHVVSLGFDSGIPVNVSWKDTGAHHLGFVQSPAAPDTFVAEFSVLVTPAGWSPEVISARWHGRPLGLKIGTGKTFNWWTDSSSPLALNTSVVNTGEESRVVTVSHWVRDYAGKFLSEKTTDVTLGPGENLAGVISIKPADRRGIYFVEVSATDKTTGLEVFARTNLTLLPPHEFKSTSADSLFGIAAYWPFPTEADAQRVMDRMGVRWYRQGNTHDFKNITALRHTQLPKKTYEEDPGAGDKWIREQLQLCVDHANPAWEFGNEINYAVMSIGMGDTVKDQERDRRIRKYLGWVKAVRRMQKEMGPEAQKVKLLSVGLAGMDVKFADAIQAAGGWDYLDGLAIHPGRGNFTADYPVSEPWEKWTSGAYGNYWNYYGSVRTGANLVKKYGTPGRPKELWLTEVYACGFPNSFWEDSLRHATENAVLSFALAQSEGVKAVMWYQLYDTVWHDQLGVNPKDREYYFGLIQRDLSFKPALLSYAAIAEALDQAKFVRWLRFDEPSKTRGLLFDTPRGPLTILWDRTDGYHLTEKSRDFASPEPWTDTWRSRVDVSLPAAGASITVINPIGQSATVSAQNGTASLTLTGAPVIVYGLDPKRLE